MVFDTLLTISVPLVIVPFTSAVTLLVKLLASSPAVAVALATVSAPAQKVFTVDPVLGSLVSVLANVLAAHIDIGRI